MKHNQQGNIAIVAAVMMAGLVGLKVVSDRQAVVKRSVDIKRGEKGANIAYNSNLNSLAYINKLFDYQNGIPGIYADNYKAKQWRLRAGPNLDTNMVKIVGDRKIEIKMPDVSANNFDSIHAGNASLPTKTTIVEVQNKILSDEKPYIEAKELLLSVSSSSGNNSQGGVESRKIMGAIPLQRPPAPEIHLYTRNFDADGFVRSVPRRKIDHVGSYKLKLTHAGESIIKLDVEVEGIASEGDYRVGGGNWIPLNLNYPANYRTIKSAGEISLKINKDLIASGGCSWATDTHDDYKDMSPDEIQKAAEIRVKQLKRSLKSQENRLTQKSNALEKGIDNVANLVSNENLSGHALARAREFLDNARLLKTSKTLNFADSKLRLIENAFRQMKVGNSGTNEVCTTTRQCTCRRQFFGWCWGGQICENKRVCSARTKRVCSNQRQCDCRWSFFGRCRGGQRCVNRRVCTDQPIVAETGMSQGLKNQFESLKKKAIDFRNALQVVLNIRSEIDKFGENINLDESFSVDIRLKGVASDVLVEGNIFFDIDKTTNCNCQDLGSSYYDYTSKSQKVTIRGDGKICGNGQNQDNEHAGLYLLSGKRPHCWSRFLRLERGECGCFDESTLITMADRSKKEISELETGDAVLNPLTGKAVPVLYVIKGPETMPLLKIITSDGNSVTVTSEHPFLTSKGYKQALALDKGDQIKVDANNHVTILDIQLSASLNKNRVVWNVMLDGGGNPENHMLIGDGIPSGDLFIQKSLNRSESKSTAKLKKSEQ